MLSALPHERLEAGLGEDLDDLPVLGRLGRHVLVRRAVHHDGRGRAGQLADDHGGELLRLLHREEGQQDQGDRPGGGLSQRAPTSHAG